MWAAIISIISAIVNPISTILKNKSEKDQAEHALEMAKIEQQTELAKQGMIQESRDMQFALEATTPWFKSFTFYLLMTPVIIMCIWPDRGLTIFHNFDLIPDWYRNLLVAVYGTIWGIRNILPTINSMLSDRRDYKLQKQSIDKKQFFNAMRAIKGVITPEEVKSLDAVIDKMDKDNA